MTSCDINPWWELRTVIHACGWKILSRDRCVTSSTHWFVASLQLKFRTIAHIRAAGNTTQNTWFSVALILVVPCYSGWVHRWVYTRVQDQRNAKFERSYRSREKTRTEFTLGSKSKVWENEVALILNHFPAKSWRSQLKKILLVWERNFQAWVPKKGPSRLVLDPKFLEPGP